MLKSFISSATLVTICFIFGLIFIKIIKLLHGLNFTVTVTRFDLMVLKWIRFECVLCCYLRVLVIFLFCLLHMSVLRFSVFIKGDAWIISRSCYVMEYVALEFETATAWYEIVGGG